MQAPTVSSGFLFIRRPRVAGALAEAQAPRFAMSEGGLIERIVKENAQTVKS